MFSLKQMAILLSLSIYSVTALAWGQNGHRTVGAIAEAYLSKKARKNIDGLLQGESLAMASTWMDDVKSDSTYDHTHDWHWVTIPDGKTYAESEKNPNGDLIETIERMKSILKSDTSSDNSRRKALKFLIHLMGDLHQPLHVGTGEDHGGNTVKVKWFYRSSNLHRIWDSEIIDSKQLSFSELAASLMEVDKDQIAKWQTGETTDWAHEIMQYREQVYDIGSEESLGYEYMYKNWNLIQLQLQKAGIRLAGVLNEIFG